MTVSNNSPSAGNIAWSGLHIQFAGQTFTIADGYTDRIYAYWTPAYPNNLVVSNTFPTLTANDCLVFLNKSGIAVVVPTATVLDGDLIVPGTVLANALAANSVTADKIAAGAVTANAIAANSVTASAIAADAVGADKIAANAILADMIVTGAVTADKIAAAAVITSKLAANAITADKVDIADLFAAAATINAIATMTVRSLENGTVLSLNENQAVFRTPEFVVEIPGASEGEIALLVDKDGSKFTDISIDGTLECSNVAKQYDGPETYTGVTSLIDILAALNNKYLSYNMSITLGATLGAINENIELVGIHGPGTVTIYGNETAASAGVVIRSCKNRIVFHDLYAAYHEIDSPKCYYIDCNATSSYTASGTETSVGNPTRTRTTYWWGTTDYIWQGFTSGNGRLYGFMWFGGLTDIASANILSASLRMKRVAGIGKGDVVNVDLYTVDNTGPSGGISNPVSRGRLGTIANGETKTFNISPSAHPGLAAALCAGKGLMFDPGDTTTLSGKVYSSNYAKFYGYRSGYDPVLTVTYELEGQILTAESTFERDNVNHTPWILITPINGTLPTSGADIPYRYRIEGKHVFVTGVINMTYTGSSKNIFQFPFAPVGNVVRWACCGGSNIARLSIGSDGMLSLDFVKSIETGDNLTSFNSWIDCSIDFWID